MRPPSPALRPAGFRAAATLESRNSCTELKRGLSWQGLRSKLGRRMNDPVEDNNRQHADGRQDGDEKENPVVGSGRINVGPDPRIGQGGKDIRRHAQDSRDHADVDEGKIALASRVIGYD